VTHLPESRMREIRTSGSEGGVAQTNAPFLPLSLCVLPVPLKLFLGETDILWHDRRDTCLKSLVFIENAEGEG